MSTIEKNKKILHFMGLKPKMDAPDSYSFSDMPWFSINNSSCERVMDSMAENIKYHSDWNKLMEVVDKCFDIDTNYQNHKKIEDALIGKSKNRIKDVYNAVIEFINAYNDDIELVGRLNNFTQWCNKNQKL